MPSRRPCRGVVLAADRGRPYGLRHHDCGAIMLVAGHDGDPVLLRVLHVGPDLL
jgi:hypothetical protein